MLDDISPNDVPKSYTDTIPRGEDGWTFKEEKLNSSIFTQTINGLSRTQNHISQTVNHLSMTVNDLSVSMTGLSASITGASAGVDGAKLSFAGVTGGATLAKADFTGAKVDEKGVSFLGRQILTWPWAEDKGARLLRKAGKSSSEAEALATNARARLNEAPEYSISRIRAEQELKKAEKLRQRAGRAHTALIELARKSAQKKKDAELSLKEARKSYREAGRNQRAAVKELRNLQNVAASAQREIG
ncbi:hypothetical protein ACGFLS_09555 [Streptomyces abikoensis]|uniref:hypothetical protein n=1 Tax=Streptomyces abikoensis TaxID=97398 RepID=UPI003722078A